MVSHGLSDADARSDLERFQTSQWLASSTIAEDDMETASVHHCSCDSPQSSEGMRLRKVWARLVPPPYKVMNYSAASGSSVHGITV